MSQHQLDELFSRYRDGCHDAFTELYHTLKQPVYTVAYRIVRSRETAEDITQEVFTRLFISPPDASVINPRAWVLRITRNLSIDALRKKQMFPVDDLDAAADDTLGDHILSWDTESAIAALSQEEREILTLHLHADLKFREIAQITETRLSYVYRTYRRALQRVRNYLNGGPL